MTSRRDPGLWFAASLVVLVAVYGTVEAFRWHERLFPGFLVLRNGVVASAGLTHWPATASGEIYGYEVTAVDGVPVRGGAEIRAAVERGAEGRLVRYRFGEGKQAFERQIPTSRFGTRDLWLLFGSFLLNGAAFGIVALLLRAMRGRDRLGRGTFSFFWLATLYTFTALDLYGPYRLFRLHVLCESFLFAGAIHMALVFPQPRRVLEGRAWLLALPYAAALPFAAAGQLGLNDPQRYVVHHGLAMLLFGVSVASLIGSQVHAWLRPASFEARQRVRIVAFGAVVALSPFLGLIVISPLVGWNASQNTMAFTAFLFPGAVGYAALRHNLLEVDSLIRRSVGYAALTLLAAVCYAGAVALTHRAFAGALDYREPVFAIVSGVVSVGLMLPLRDHAQALIDRLFFRNAYDYRRIVEETSGRLAAATELAELARELHYAVERALHPQGVGFFVRGERNELLAVGDPGDRGVPSDLPIDRKSIDVPDGGLVIPFRSEDELVAALVLGPPRSGGMYSGEDRALLHTLAHQGAVAVRNALALEQLRELNRNLEGKVEARTHDLQKALDELRSTQTQLLHREKMASLGQFVAGIAHELNNPLNFIVGNFHYLQAYMRTLVATLHDYEAASRADGAPALADRLAQIRAEHGVDVAIGDLKQVFDGCAEGIERATGLVRDLRSFSRPDRGESTVIQLNDALDATLTLLRGPLAGCRLVRDYGELPAVECLAGQLNQVFMNLIANARDAVEGKGTVIVRTRDLGGDRVAVEVEDDGCGLDPASIERIFDPFYTTKPVGKGTGLGLAISYGIVARHGGSIQVTSAPGRGSTFRVELPTAMARPALAPPETLEP
ncbi:MAG: ATP-binding protein [Myxococcota bacterium]